jgi:hypothetical protein
MFGMVEGIDRFYYAFHAFGVKHDHMRRSLEAIQRHPFSGFAKALVAVAG